MTRPANAPALQAVTLIRDLQRKAAERAAAHADARLRDARDHLEELTAELEALHVAWQTSTTEGHGGFEASFRWSAAWRRQAALCVDHHRQMAELEADARDERQRWESAIGLHDAARTDERRDRIRGRARRDDALVEEMLNGRTGASE
jgi:hypothetical protein